MKISDVKIDPDFENLLPALSDEEFLGLEEDICKRRKVYDPILVWSKDNSIIDGHNRYKIIVAHKIENYTIEPMDFDKKSDVMDYIINHQLSRRNLKKSELVQAYSKFEEEKAKEAKARMEKGDNQHTKSPGSNLNEGSAEPIRTAAEVAKKIGVSENTYRDMKTIIQKGSSEQIARMDKGGKGNGVSAIAKEIKDGIPDGHRKCRVCGEVKPVSEFKSGENLCKSCRNKQDAAQRRPDKFIAPESNPDYYNTNAVVVKTIKDLEMQLEYDFNQCQGIIEHTLRFYKEAIRSNDDKEKVFTKLKKFMSTIKFIETEVRNESY